MSKTTAKSVANWIVEYCNEHGDLVSNLKLQKLIYYAQAWYLALYNEPLFNERLEAWVHGPVQPTLYRTFKKFGYKPITECTKSTLDEKHKFHVLEVLKAYGRLQAFELEQLVHSEQPWIAARGKLAPDANGNGLIRHEDMQSFYKAKIRAKARS
ncbi:MAG: type II toxin-antitoxin system antitoxin SocA domain-containing protein [Tepidisphaeraceae bacterium]|jgi:uncharacterized phage-associated protein